MSVINKMLKDLEDRSVSNTESGHGPSAVPVAQKSNASLLIVALVLLLIANVIGWFVYQLYTENQSLKTRSAEAIQPTANKTEPEVLKPIITKSVSKTTQTEKIVTPINEDVKSTFSESKPLASPQILQKQSKNDTPDSSENEPAFPKTNTQKSAPIKQVQVEKTAEKKAKPVMKVERKQLSPKELAAKKMARAERAITENDTQLAEKLFEEVLILVPNHQIARKQLAALWYGRQAYRPALNLLQQGLAIDRDNSDFRLMKARIYLTQGQVAPAFDVLSVLKNTQNIEYQSLLANAAQQLQNFSAAENAYQQLVSLEPQNGRWWLGLAVAQDSNSNFAQAMESYAAAIQQGGISQSASDFAKQRIAELGE